MNNEIIISNIDPQNIVIDGGGTTIGITTVYVNDVDVTVGNVAYVVVPTKLSELQNNVGFITSAQEQDPTVPYYVKQISIADINNWNSKQDELVSGTNIKTINGESILGEGNLVVDTSYTAGTGINISDENVISNTITSYDDLTDLPTIPTAVSDLTNDLDFVPSSSLSPVAFSGDYDDLVDKPTIPTQTSDLDNDSGFITNRVDDLLNYYDKDFLYGLLPKVSDEDTFINLSGTYASKLKLVLNPTELSQDATPTPSSPEDVHVITGENIINIYGGNLFDENTYKTSTYSTGIYKYTSLNITGNRRLYFKASLKPGKSTIGGLYLDLTSNGSNPNTGTTCLAVSNGIITGSATLYSKDFTGITDLYLAFYPTTINVSDIFDTYNLWISTDDISYEPYYTPVNYTVDLGTTEYCKIQNYADRIFRNVEGDPDYDSERTGTWYIKKNIGKVVLDGNTNLSVNATASYTQAVVNTPTINSDVGDATSSGYSNYFQCNYNNVAGNFYISNSKTNIYLVFDTTLNTSELINQWLSSHNTIIYYPLATPTYTQITGTLEDELENIYQNAMSYTGQTNISQINDDLPFTISATTLKDISNL